mgnify:CR=1 FL=1
MSASPPLDPIEKDASDHVASDKRPRSADTNGPSPPLVDEFTPRVGRGIFPEVTGLLQRRVLDLVTRSAEYKYLKAGLNVVSSAIDRGDADFLVIAADAEPLEIVMHLPAQCEARGVRYCFVASKVALGRAARLERPTVAVAMTNALSVSAVVADKAATAWSHRHQLGVVIREVERLYL